MLPCTGGQHTQTGYLSSHRGVRNVAASYESNWKAKTQMQCHVLHTSGLLSVINGNLNCHQYNFSTVKKAIVINQSPKHCESNHPDLLRL